MTSIPASQLVNVIPGVLGAGGNPLALNSVFFTQDDSVPLGTVKSFPTAQAVADWFGPSSTEAAMAAIYFAGFNGASLLPGLLYFMQFNTASVEAYLRGGSVAGMTLAQLQALSGQLTITVDGVASTSAAIDLSSATSFSNAAVLIQTGIQAGTPASTATCTYDSQRAAFVVHSPTTGASSTIGFATGTLSAGLKLTSALGAVTSQGAVAPTPAAAIATLVAQTQNWALLMTLWEPVTADKVLFAAAVNAYPDRYVYVGWDTDTGPSEGEDADCFAVLTASYDGRIAEWGPTGNTGAIAKAAFICGMTASINFDETNGRIDYAYKAQSGLTPDVTDATVAAYLEANGYNFYGKYATANEQFEFLQRGQISGQWKWIDSYVNQIRMTSDFQLALIRFLQQSKSVPYVTRGYDGIRAAMLDPIQAHVNFGSIVAGVTLSAAQRAQVNTAAGGGINIADTLQTRGWYLQILPASPSTRADRGSPPMTFWYTDGGSIQRINLASIEVQ